MTANGKLIGLFLLSILALIFSLYVYGMINKGKFGTTSPSISAEAEVDKDIEELNKIFMEYQLDVYVTSAHMAGHSTSSAALRCLNNKGNVSAFSEFNTRRIHLLCVENDTLYDIIINRINFWVEKFKNPKSELVTAYAPENIQGADATNKVSFYLEHLKNTVGGKVVRLYFGPGEVMFIPK